MGPIKGRWIAPSVKGELLDLLDQAKAHGVSYRHSCELLMVNYRRVVRWQQRCKQGMDLRDAKPGPRHASHRLLPEERHAVLELAGRAEHADVSHRTLTVIGWDEGLVWVSFSTVYRILSAQDLMWPRGVHRHHNARSLPPVRREVTGPNQRWCWDVSYLLTFQKRLFVYLYLLLDEFSRKAIHWLLSWRESWEDAERLLEEGLIAQNILDLPEDDRPEVVNDRGRQMTAKPIRQLFEDHHMPQLFARPRTPNDNPYVESAFSTIKRAPAYPGRFLDRDDAAAYFSQFFLWYNTEHYHSGIDYVTPEQAHQGLRDEIVAARKNQLLQQRQLRKEVNRLEHTQSTQPNPTNIQSPPSISFL